MKYYRVTLYLFGKESKGDWLPYDVNSFIKDVKTFADNDCYFEVEFKYI